MLQLMLHYKIVIILKVISPLFLLQNDHMEKLTNKQKKDWAKTLYLKERLTQKELAGRVGVSENTISKWVNDEGWEKLRKNMMLTREEQMQLMLNELEALNTFIQKKPAGERFADSKEANIRRNLVKDIKELETKASLAEIIETGKRFIKWLSVADIKKAREIADLFDAFIKDNLR